MKQLKAQTLFESLETIQDPRLDRQKLHSLTDILVIAVCATICGVEIWTEIEEFVKLNKSGGEFLGIGEWDSLA